MHKLYEDIKQMLDNELSKISAQNDLTDKTLEDVHKLTSSIKNICKILEEEGKKDYIPLSGNMTDEQFDRKNSNRYYHPYYYMDNGNSYDDGYMRNGHSNYGNGYRINMYPIHNEHDYSRHTAKERMIERMEDMMYDAQTEQERYTIKRCIDELRSQR